MKKTTFLLLFLLFGQLLSAQEHHKQQFTIQKVRIVPNQSEDNQRFLEVYFDCQFKTLVKDLSKARYKFSVQIKTANGRAVYQDASNSVSALATANFDKGNKPYAESLRLRIPYSKISLEAGQNSLVMEWEAQSSDYPEAKRFPALHQHRFELEGLAADQKVSYSAQEFSIKDIKLEKAEMMGTRGVKFYFDLQAKHAYYEIENPKKIENPGDYYLFVLLKDSTGKVVYTPPSANRNFELRRQLVRPMPNERKGKAIVNEIEMFVPYQAIDMPSGEIYPIVEIYARNYDSTIVLPRIKAQKMLLIKPPAFNFEEQSFQISNFSYKDQQKHEGVGGLRIAFDAKMGFGGKDIGGSELDKQLRYYCFYATLTSENGVEVYRAPLSPERYQEGGYHYGILQPEKQNPQGKAEWLIPYKDILLDEGSQQVRLDIHASDLSGQRIIQKIYSQDISLEQVPTYFARLALQNSQVASAKQWPAASKDIPVMEDFIKLKGKEAAPNALWKVFVGKEEVFASRSNERKSSLSKEIAVFKTAEGDQIQVAVYDDKFNSPGKHLALVQLDNKAGADAQKPELKSGALLASSWNFQETAAPQIKRSELSLQNNYQHEGSTGVLLRFGYRIANFPTEGKLYVQILSKKPQVSQIQLMELARMVSGNARRDARGFFELKEAAQTLQIFVPHYAFPEGESPEAVLAQLGVRFYYDQFELQFGTSFDSTAIAFTQVEDISLSIESSEVIQQEGLTCARLRLRYRMPEAYFKDLKKGIKFEYQLQAGQEALHPLLQSNQKALDSFTLLPESHEGFFDLVLPYHLLAKALPEPYQLPFELQVNIPKLRHSPQSLVWEVPQERLLFTRWQMSELLREKVSYYPDVYWVVKLGGQEVFASAPQPESPSKPWKAEENFGIRLHPKDQIEVAIMETNAPRNRKAAVATWIGTVEMLKQQEGEIKIKAKNLKKATLKFRATSK